MHWQAKESNGMNFKKGMIYGLGLGPGDPDLMSLKAHCLLRDSNNIAFFRKKGAKGRARSIAEGLLKETVNEIAMEYPVTTEISSKTKRYNELLAGFYAECTKKIKLVSDKGLSVSVLCEGDPFFYGSFMHIYMRVKDTHPVTVVPGITGMSAAWTETGFPITWGDDVLSVITGTLPEASLIKKMRASDAIVIMKVGRHLAKVRRALKVAGHYEKAWLVQYAAMKDCAVHKLSHVQKDEVPYFSIILVHGKGRRP